MHSCAVSDPHKKYAYLFRLHQLVAEMTLPNSMHSWTQAQMPFLLTKHGQKSTKYHLHPYETQFLLQSHLRDHTFNGLNQFFTFHLILSNCFRLWTMRRFSTRTHLSHTLHIFTNTCLPHGKPYAIKLNLILDSLSLYCAWLCYHTHAHHMFYASLSFCHYHVVISCPAYLDMPFSDSISRSNTNMYIQYDSI